jgi:hypothetical protein
VDNRSEIQNPTVRHSVQNKTKWRRISRWKRNPQLSCPNGAHFNVKMYERGQISDVSAYAENSTS